MVVVENVRWMDFLPHAQKGPGTLSLPPSTPNFTSLQDVLDHAESNRRGSCSFKLTFQGSVEALSVVVAGIANEDAKTVKTIIFPWLLSHAALIQQHGRDLSSRSFGLGQVL